MKLLIAVFVLMIAGCASLPDSKPRGSTAADAWCLDHKGVFWFSKQSTVFISEDGTRSTYTERLNEIKVTCNDGTMFVAPVNNKFEVQK